MAKFSVDLAPKKTEIKAVLADGGLGLFLRVRGGGIMYLEPSTMELVEHESNFSLEYVANSTKGRKPLTEGHVITIEL